MKTVESDNCPKRKNQKKRKNEKRKTYFLVMHIAFNEQQLPAFTKCQLNMCFMIPPILSVDFLYETEPGSWSIMLSLYMYVKQSLTWNSLSLNKTVKTEMHAQNLYRANIQ